jgi:hypothetical protein
MTDLSNLDGAEMIMTDPYTEEMLIAWFGGSTYILMNADMNALDVRHTAENAKSAHEARGEAEEWFDDIYKAAEEEE